MKLDFKGTEKPCHMKMRVLLNAWLNYNDIHIFERDIEVSYNNVYDFWDIDIFKWCVKSSGNGTPEYRDQKWKDNIQAIINLFELKEEDLKSTWRWHNHNKYNGLELDHKQIPGIRFWIYRK